LLTGAANAQSVAFEVATVKPSDVRPGAVIGLFTYPGGRINATSLTLRNLVALAYGIQDYQLSGGPNWASSDRWDVVARPPANSEASKFNPPTVKTAPTPEMLRMLRALIEERFQLTMHEETKQGPAYALLAGDKRAKLNRPKDPEEFRVVVYGRTGKADNPDFLEGHNASMDRLAKRLADLLHRPVLNQTRIDGDFDFRFEYAGHLSEAGRSMFTAIQDELGLKIVSTNGPVEVWVIDGAERPTAN
jgi:uncharacterized protein (TIGR03435 family)